jgi:GTP-binding protein
MSRATPEVAPYPFTTLHPLMGVVEYRDGTQIKVADIPGLIAGASQGRGKGIDFLRHVERTKALCYMLDVAGTEGRDPHEDLRVLVNEISSYAEGVLMDRSALVVANKTDLIEPERLQDLIMSIQETSDSLGIARWSPVVGISAAVTGAGLETLSKDMRSIVEQSRSIEEPVLQGA